MLDYCIYHIRMDTPEPQKQFELWWAWHSISRLKSLSQENSDPKCRNNIVVTTNNPADWKPVLFFTPSCKFGQCFKALPVVAMRSLHNTCAFRHCHCRQWVMRELFTFPDLCAHREFGTQSLMFCQMESKNVNIPKPPICVASNMCASSKNVNIPKPPICVAWNMCASSKNVNIPKPPICVASNMCASSKNVNIPKPPICVASNMCASSRNVIIPPPPPHPDNLTSRKRKNNLNNFLTKSARNPHEMHVLKIWWLFFRKFAMKFWASSGPWREHWKCTKYCK